MSRLLVLNLEDFGLTQDISKTIQSINAVCICCLSSDIPLLDLEKCSHSDYLESFRTSELKQFNQLVCLQCHNTLKKIKSFQIQVLDSYKNLLSGVTHTTVNRKVINLTVQKVNSLSLLPNEDLEKEILNDNEDSADFCQVPIEPTFQNETIVGQNIKNGKEFVDSDYTAEVHIDSSMQLNVTEGIQDDIKRNFCDELPNVSNIVEQDFVQGFQENIVEQNFTNDVASNTCNEENINQGKTLISKNIKTALEIIERNNKNFVGFGSQLQFLNGENLTFLEATLLNKDILNEIPLASSKNTSTALENELLHKSKLLGIKIDGGEKMFIESFNQTTDFIEKETDATEIINDLQDVVKIQIENVSNNQLKSLKPRKRRFKTESNHTKFVRRVTLSHEELDRERVLQAQSKAYLKLKYRCETCIIGFNFKENLEYHVQTKHGPREGKAVICDICSQVIPDMGHVTQHLYRHYTRYECIQCNQRFQALDEALQHSKRHMKIPSPMNKRTKIRPRAANIKSP